MIHKTTPKPSIWKENNQGQRSGGRSLREHSKPSTQIGSFQPQQNSAQLYKTVGFFFVPSCLSNQWTLKV